MLIPTGRLLTTSPTATSSLLFGLATYVLRGMTVFLGGDRGVVKDVLGARDQDDVEVDGLELAMFETEDISDILGDAAPRRRVGVCVRACIGAPDITVADSHGQSRRWLAGAIQVSRSSRTDIVQSN
jgi:hypothetical protein